MNRAEKIKALHAAIGDGVVRVTHRKSFLGIPYGTTEVRYVWIEDRPDLNCWKVFLSGYRKPYFRGDGNYCAVQFRKADGERHIQRGSTGVTYQVSNGWEFDDRDERRSAEGCTDVIRMIDAAYPLYLKSGSK